MKEWKRWMCNLNLYRYAWRARQESYASLIEDVAAHLREENTAFYDDDTLGNKTVAITRELPAITQGLELL